MKFYLITPHAYILQSQVNLGNKALTAIETTQDEPFLDIDQIDQLELLKSIYDKMVHWRNNIFRIPSGKLGKLFITEMTSLINSWNNKDCGKSTALIKLMIFPNLMLQKPEKNIKADKIKLHLQRRLTLWEEKKIQRFI